MLSFLNPYVLLALLLCCGSGYGVGRISQYRSDKAEQTAALLKATQEARAKEQEWGVIYKETTDAKETELRAVAVERDSALLRLRQRPQRLPEVARAACAGTTGRELSERDAEAFTRLAARADTIRAELGACQARESIGR